MTEPISPIDVNLNADSSYQTRDEVSLSSTNVGRSDTPPSSTSTPPLTPGPGGAPPGAGVLASSIPFPDPTTLNTYQDDSTDTTSNSDTLSPLTSTSSTYSKRKSHARRQPPGHIPRPRNAFILFRCDFVKQKKIPEHVEANHRNISRIAGMVWRGMSTGQRAPWVGFAEVEKRRHGERWPGYRYRPGGGEGRGREKERDASVGAGKGRKRGGAMDRMRSWNVDISASSSSSVVGLSSTPPPPPLMLPVSSMPSGLRRRSSSCPPPGAVPVQNVGFDYPYYHQQQLSQDQQQQQLQQQYGARDDLSQRRPSRVTFYQSIQPHRQYNANSAPSYSNLSLPPDLPPSAVPPMYWNLPMPPSPEGVVSVGGIDVGGVGMPGCPPGWDSSPPRAEKWTEWREDGDVETGFMRCVVMRNNDYDNSFKNGVPVWTDGLFQQNQQQQGQGDAQSSEASVRPTPTFTNPFDAGASHSFSNEAEAELSPLDGSELDAFRLPPPPPPDIASGGYEMNPFGFYRHGAATGGGEDQLEFDLGSLMPRLSLAEDSQA
ncbi:hypothetical protein PQX77_005655 [Marasmius sp. AFHP31]|nr:hypothetical protein PQX77_005655 [Marasmius sp. AFHP31]